MASYRYERDIKPEDLIQETPPPLTPAQQRANWWHYHWYYVVLIAAALLAVGYFVWNRVTEVQPDYTVAVVSRTDPDTAFLSQLETQLEALAGDVNGDGNCTIDDLVMLNQYLLGILHADASQIAAMDCCADGKIDMRDSLILEQFLVYMIDTLPVEP